MKYEIKDAQAGEAIKMILTVLGIKYKATNGYYFEKIWKGGHLNWKSITIEVDEKDLLKARLSLVTAKLSAMSGVGKS